MTIIESLIRLRDDIKEWVENNLNVKLDKNLGKTNKILSTDENGEIIAVINIDSELSEISENPVQNKAVQAALEEKLNRNLGETNKILATNEHGEITTIDSVTIEVDSELSETSKNPVQNKVVQEALRVKLDKNLGANNANKILSTDAEGNITPIDQVEIEIDTELSDSSENPVQNKIIHAALETKLDKNLGADKEGQLLAVNAQGDVTTITQDQVTIDVDTELSDTSENPVQNKVVTEALKMESRIHRELTYSDTSRPKSYRKYGIPTVTEDHLPTGLTAGLGFEFVEWKVTKFIVTLNGAGTVKFLDLKIETLEDGSYSVTLYSVLGEVYSTSGKAELAIPSGSLWLDGHTIMACSDQDIIETFDYYDHPGMPVFESGIDYFNMPEGDTIQCASGSVREFLTADFACVDCYLTNPLAASRSAQNNLEEVADKIITDYTELENAPSITEEEPGTATYADEDGNIIAKIDSNGFETTKVTTNSLAFSNITTEDVGKHLAIKEDGTIETTTPGTQVQLITWEAED